MPKIPQAEFRARLSLDVPRDPVAPGRDLQAEAVSTFGRAAADLGGQIAQMRLKSETDDFVSNKSNDYIMGLNESVANRKAEFANDPKGMTEAIRKDGEDLMRRIEKDSPNNFATNGFRRQAGNFLRSAIVSSSSKEHLELAKKRRENLSRGIDNLALQVWQNPDPVQAKTLFNKGLEDIRSKIGTDLTPDEALLQEAKLRLRFTESKVLGLTKLGQYKAAKKVIESNEFQGLTTQSAQKLFDEVGKRARQNTDLKLREEEKNIVALEKSHRELTGNIQKQLLQKVSKGEDVQQEVKDLRNSGVFDFDALKLVSSNEATSGQKANSLENKFNLALRMTEMDDPIGIQKDINELLNKGQLTVEDALSLTDQINNRITMKEVSPARRQAIKANEKKLKAAFPTDPLFGGGNARANQALLPQVMIEYQELIGQGADPFKATSAVLKKYTTPLEAVDIIPGVPVAIQNDPLKNGRNIGKILKRRFNSQIISRKQYKRDLRLLKQRIEAAKLMDKASITDILEEIKANK